jgi:hypothetical protein
MGPPLRVQNGLPLNRVYCSNRVLGNTMYSAEDFVDDSVLTVYNRSVSSAKVSGTLGRETLQLILSRLRKVSTNTKSEYCPIHITEKKLSRHSLLIRTRNCLFC